MGLPNTAPRFTKAANVSSVALTQALTASTKSDGALTIDTDAKVLFSADTTNGSFIDRIIAMAYANVAASNSQQTVLRFYISSQHAGGAACTNTDTHLIGELAIPAIPADHSTNAINPYVLPLGIPIGANQYIIVSTHAAMAANTGLQITAFGGDY